MSAVPTAQIPPEFYSLYLKVQWDAFGGPAPPNHCPTQHKAPTHQKPLALAHLMLRQMMIKIPSVSESPLSPHLQISFS